MIRFAVGVTKCQRIKLQNVLPLKEHNYCNEMVDEGANTRRVLGRLCLYYAANKLENTPISEVEIIHAKNGKPEIENLSISISHTACLEDTQICVCTAAKNSSASFGIDIAMRNKPLSHNITVPELIQRLKQNKSLGTAHEWEQVFKFEDPVDQLNEFYRFWAIKESVLKATGEGASALRPSKIEITTNAAHPFNSRDIYVDDSVFKINEESQNCRVFEEILKIGDTEFYVAETSLLPNDSTEEHSGYVPIQNILVSEILKSFL